MLSPWSCQVGVVAPGDVLPPDTARLTDQLEQWIDDPALSMVQEETHPFADQHRLGCAQAPGELLQAAVLFFRQQDLDACHEWPAGSSG